MKESSNFFNLLKAGYACLWVQTHEEDRCIAELRNQAKIYETYSWDLISGLKCHDPQSTESIPDPLSILMRISTMPETSILFLKDFHKFIPGIEIFRALKNAIPEMKARDKHVVIVSPVIDIPLEMEKDITVFDFDLPTVADLMQIAHRMVIDNEMTDVPVDEQAIAAAKGLTLMEAEDAMAFSLITKKKFDREVMEAAKLQAVKKSGLMELYLPEPEENLGGLEPLKQYLHNRKDGFFSDSKSTPKGILLTGVPGGGKSLSAKVTAAIFNLPILKLDFSSLKGSLQGESDRNIRRVTQLADAIGSCVLFMDEVEKALGGVASSNQTDGGTTASMFGHLLTWMQETKSRVYIVATCNDMEPLLTISQGALLRRFDDIFFVDVPSFSERCRILEIMNARYGTSVDDKYMVKAENWTGAEIEKFVKSSIYDGDEFAFDNVHPIYDQNRVIIEKARDWAKVNARRANMVDVVAVNPQKDQKVRKLKVS